MSIKGRDFGYTAKRYGTLADIGGRALKWAQHLRAGEADGPAAPRQVFATS